MDNKTPKICVPTICVCLLTSEQLVSIMTKISLALHCTTQLHCTTSIYTKYMYSSLVSPERHRISPHRSQLL